MSEQFMIQLMVVINTFLIAVLGAMSPFIVVWANRLKRQTNAIGHLTAEVHGQTVNHHPESPNMREENDGRHAETLQMFAHVNAKLDRHTILQDDLVTLGLENRYKIDSALKRLDHIERNTNNGQHP